MSFVSELHLGEDGLDGVEVGGVGGVEDGSDVELSESIHDIVSLMSREIIKEDGKFDPLVQRSQLPDERHHAGSVEGPVLDHDVVHAAVAIDASQSCEVRTVDDLLVQFDVSTLIRISQSRISPLGVGGVLDVDYFGAAVICCLQLLAGLLGHVGTD